MKCTLWRCPDISRCLIYGCESPLMDDAHVTEPPAPRMTRLPDEVVKIVADAMGETPERKP